MKHLVALIKATCVIALFLVSTNLAEAGTLNPFSYSAGSYVAGATTNYTFTFTTQTEVGASPQIIFRTLFGTTRGISLPNPLNVTVTVDGVSKTPTEIWWGGGSNNAYIRLGEVVPAGSDVVIVLQNVVNGSAGTYNWSGTVFTADSGANPIDSPASIQSLTLVAGDVTAPTVSTLSPTDDTASVAVDSNLVITFDEDVDVENGNIIIYSADDEVFETIDITSGQVTGTGTDTITINPTTNFAYATGYYVQIASTAIDDTSGNSYAGIVDSTTWNFTTAAAPASGSRGSSLSKPATPEITVSGKGLEASVRGTYNSNKAVISTMGFEYWNESNEDDVEVVAYDFKVDSYTHLLRDLKCGATYNVRGFAKNSAYTTYARIVKFETAVCKQSTEEEQGMTDTQATDDLVKKEQSADTEQHLATTTQFDVRDLTIGMTGDDVQALQTMLIRLETGEHAAALATIGATGYFATYTQNALAEYQLRHAIYPSVGYFGPITRAQMKLAAVEGVWW